MKYVKLFYVLVLLGVAATAFAQKAVQDETSPGRETLAGVIDKEITNLENQFVGAAEAMPENKFDASPETWKLPGSEFKGVRTFAGQIRHVAADNIAICAPLADQPEPAGNNAPNGPMNLTTRAELLKFLKDSFSFGHKAVAGLTSANELELVEFRGKKVTRISLAILALTHTNDHYGQMVEYLRMNGIVPPASRPR
ncbi:MAG: DinB family protein [Acidobacteriia bacterium]|nr:DinB family protein [Terriglobia bacterium]